jgi:hypothetical protein
MPEQDDDFTKTIKTVFTERSAALRKNYDERERIHSRFERAWTPLIEHMKGLAERHLPEDKRLDISLEVDQKLDVRMKIALSEPSGLEDMWHTIASMHFINDMGTDKEWFTEHFQESVKKNKKHWWHASSRSPDLALKDLNRDQHAVIGQQSYLHPDDMDVAKRYLEKWLATQIAFNFDQARIYPKSTLEITLKRTKSGPDRTPS